MLSFKYTPSKYKDAFQNEPSANTYTTKNTNNYNEQFTNTDTTKNPNNDNNNDDDDNTDIDNERGSQAVRHCPI